MKDLNLLNNRFLQIFVKYFCLENGFFQSSEYSENLEVLALLNSLENHDFHCFLDMSV